MDTAWIAPPLVLLAGAAVAAGLLRRIAGATEDLRAARRRFGHLEQGLIPVRVEARRTRASIDRYDPR